MAGGASVSAKEDKGEAKHGPPYLEDLVQQALVWAGALEWASLRELCPPSAGQAWTLSALWDLLLDLPYRGKASCVGITKAVMFLTEGRIGPSLDSRVRKKLGMPKPMGAQEWLDQLEAISEDLRAFEERNRVRLEERVPHELGKLAVGRAYDVLAWS